VVGVTPAQVAVRAPVRAAPRAEALTLGAVTAPAYASLASLRAAPPVNLSALHYGGVGGRFRAVAAAEDHSLVAAPDGAMRTAAVMTAPPALRVAPGAIEHRWNAARGVALSGDAMASGVRRATLAVDGASLLRTVMVPRSMSWEGGEICCEPQLLRTEDKDCCSYGITDNAAGQSVMYRQPLHAFSTEAGSRAFAKGVRASMPMFLPYWDSNVRPTNGWIYQKGTFHGATDYSKTSDAYGAGIDPTFGVHAVADGKVVTVLWDNWLGNTVVIEHTAPNGDRYRSVFMHLRDGYTHDLQKARAISLAGMDTSSGSYPSYGAYSKFANLKDPSTQHWGTDQQRIKVKVNDTVRAGDQIAWSGNTGAGGAGAGLNSDGTPKNAHTANNHLHLMMAAPDPRTGSESDWVQVDPYGVYGQVENKDGDRCYELLEETAYARLYAPFYPSFHHVPIAWVSKYFGYYTGMGMALQTISLYRGDDGVLAAGSFQYGAPKPWLCRFYATAADYQDWFDEYHGKGYRPREVVVTKASDGTPRFSSIWQRRTNETYYAYTRLTDAEWDAKWNELVKQKSYRVDDHFIYDDKGTTRHAGIFVKDGITAFFSRSALTGSDFQKAFDDYWKQGFRLVSLNASELKGGTRFTGVWRKMPGAWVAHFGLTPGEYQEKFLHYGAAGYRAHKVQGYAGADRLAAIWTKP